MAIALLSLTGVSGGNGTTVASFSLTKPTGLVDAAVMLLGISSNNGTATGGSQAKNTNATWTRLVAGEDAATANVGLSIFWRVVPTAASEASSYPFSFVQFSDDVTSQTVSYGWALAGFSGVDNTTPIDVTTPATNPNPTAGSTTQTFPATSSVTDNAWTVAFAVADQTSLTWTVPTGYANLVAQAAGRAVALATKGPITPAGTIASGSFGGTAAPGVGGAVVLRPAGAGPADPFPAGYLSAYRRPPNMRTLLAR